MFRSHDEPIPTMEYRCAPSAVSIIHLGTFQLSRKTPIRLNARTAVTNFLLPTAENQFKQGRGVWLMWVIGTLLVLPGIALASMCVDYVRQEFARTNARLDAIETKLEELESENR